jgi:hypothetical protein
MLTRTRPREESSRSQPTDDGPAFPAGHLSALRAQGESLLHAADEAIDRALSGDPLRFLQEVEQGGGQ